MKRWLPCVVLACAALIACDKSPKNDDNAASAASAVTLSDEDIPVAEDYIDNATKEVTADNYAAELDKIEKEINAAQ